MTAPTRLLNRQRLEAPRKNGSVVCLPPLSAVGDLLSSNRELRADGQVSIHGQPLLDLAAAARAELLPAARRYTATYRDVPSETTGEVVFLAGHQAEIFHPGVWAKNFVLHHLAARHGGTAINLVVDSDTVKHTGLWVPGGSPTNPTRRMVPFDREADEIPAEERYVLDESLWNSFAQRVTTEIASLVPHPLVNKYWPMVLRRSQAGERMGAAIAQARHQLEGDWGLETLELPLSHTARFAAFHGFVAALVADLPRLRPLYNQVVHEYRRLHRIRSCSHPVPDLAAEDGWLEAPFWIWTESDPRRHRLFVRRQGADVILSDRTAVEIRLPLGAEDRLDKASDALADAAARGILIRTRALTTTLWARLVLGDLFIHGIGGAAYDQITDLLIERYLDREPPAFMTVSATLHLPIEHASFTPDDLRRLHAQLRELRFNPDRTLDSHSPQDARQWMVAKRRWIMTPPTPENARERFLAIREANEALQPWVAAQRAHLERERDGIGRGLRVERVLASREYGFCLYPEKNLRDFLLAIAPSTP